MIQETFTCKVCGSNTFAQGEVSNGYANVMPAGKILSTGSPIIYTFCKNCGEVVSIKIAKPYKF
jgi:transcription elongation factor Elf1